MNDHIERPCENDFSTDQYVQRAKPETSIRRWLRNPGADRKLVMSLIGSPGSGKSWLLAHMHQELASEGAFVLFLTASQLMDLKQHDQVKNEIIDNANVACAGLNYPHDLSPSLSALVEDVTRRLCTRCAGQRFVVLIDGCDDLASQTEFDTLQRVYLRPFFAGGARCFRMIIARRLELTDHTLRRLGHLLSVGVFENDNETNTHRRRLSTHVPGFAASWPSLPAGCNYRWDHPYINCYLMASLRSGNITTATLVSCCRAVIERSLPGKPVEHKATVGEDLRRLGLMTQYKDRWTSGDFRDRISEDLDDTYIPRGLITARRADDKFSGPTYQVVDGLRELLAALPEEELRS